MFHNATQRRHVDDTGLYEQHALLGDFHNDDDVCALISIHNALSQSKIVFRSCVEQFEKIVDAMLVLMHLRTMVLVIHTSQWFDTC